MNDFKFSDYFGAYPPVIPRAKVSRYFPWLSPKRLANLDMVGAGPSHAFKNGRAVLYPTWAFLQWLDERTSPHGRRKNPVPPNYDPVKRKHNPQKNGRRGRKTKAQEVRERRG